MAIVHLEFQLVWPVTSLAKTALKSSVNSESLPGGQIAIVRYSSEHNPQDEWIYNAADIDQSKVIWAREMDPSKQPRAVSIL